jgi:hypothetical protein
VSARQHVLLFDRRFAAPIEGGTKKHTLRLERSRPIMVGDRLSLRIWEGVPYRAGSMQRVLREAICVYKSEAVVHEWGVRFRPGTQSARLWDATHHPFFLQGFANKDGFSNWAEMRAYFRTHRMIDLKMSLIEWSCG